MRRLARNPHRQPRPASGFTRNRGDAAWLERDRRYAWVIDPQLDRHLGVLEGLIDISAFPLERVADVAAHLGMHERRVGLERGLCRADGWQGVELDLH